MTPIPDRCPRCGNVVQLVCTRLTPDHRIRRYGCRRPHGCGWLWQGKVSEPRDDLRKHSALKSEAGKQ